MHRRAIWPGWSALEKNLHGQGHLLRGAPDKSPADLIETLRRFCGPSMSAFEAAEKSGKVEELHKQLLEMANAQNTSADGGTSMPATFLRVIVSL